MLVSGRVCHVYDRGLVSYDCLKASVIHFMTHRSSVENYGWKRHFSWPSSLKPKILVHFSLGTVIISHFIFNVLKNAVPEKTGTMKSRISRYFPWVFQSPFWSLKAGFRLWVGPAKGWRNPTRVGKATFRFPRNALILREGKAFRYKDREV